MKGAPLGPCGERATSLNNVAEARSMWHEHGVNVDLVKEGCWQVNSWQETSLCHLAELALIAHFNIPLDIAVE